MTEHLPAFITFFCVFNFIWVVYLLIKYKKINGNLISINEKISKSISRNCSVEGYKPVRPLKVKKKKKK